MNRKNFKLCFAILLFSFLPDLLFAQCSDAGVCQLGYLGNVEEHKLNISLSYKNGYGGKENDITFHSFQINAQYKLFRASNISLSLPYNIQDGPGGNANGIGDLLLSLTQELFNNDKSAFDIIFGAKLATGNENKERLLPQVYQPGLGSNDFIFAANYYYKNFGFGAGYQLNGGRNDKENLKLKRGDDLMLRTNYSFSLDDFQFNPQLIFIKQLSESSILDLNSSGENFIEIENSDQSQLNFLFLVDYLLNENYSLFGEVAIPFLKRDINIDGLKRAYTFFLGFRFSY